jgi:SAM-dependent methyltransferase
VASISSSPGRTKFGENATAYDFARPAYRPELFDWLRATCSLGPESDCLEIGAGTGHATLPVLATPVRSLLAIEPDGALVARLRDKAGADDRLTIAAERFEKAELQTDDYDFAFAATSFHWLPRMKSLQRVRAALKPGGWFAMWWDVFHDPARPDAFDDASAHLFDGLEQDPETTANRPAFALDVASRLGEMRSAGFVNTQHKLFQREVSFTPDHLAALYATFSRVRTAPEAKRETLLDEVRRIVSDSFGGEVVRSIATSAFLGRRD